MSRKLTKVELIELATTLDGSLIKRFPKNIYGYTRDELRQTKKEMLSGGSTVLPEVSVEYDKRIKRAKDVGRQTSKKYKVLLEENEILVAENEAILQLSEHSGDPIVIKKRSSNGKGEAIANALLSDVHVEERVQKKEVEGMNAYNLEIASARLLKGYFPTILRLVEIEQVSSNVNELVLWLLGDNITGWLHEESIHTTFLPPVDAAILARDLLKSGIDFLLENSKLHITVPCIVGNHGRMTHRPNHATENGNSLETFIYHDLAKSFAGNDRIEFQISESGFVFVEEYGFVIRGHHGHRIRYQGGVQGIGVPASKKLAQWNKLRVANLDVFGHHHTAQSGDGFIANGSVIGYNSYAYKCGFSYQPPEQKFFVVHSKWKRPNLVRSIFFDQ